MSKDLEDLVIKLASSMSNPKLQDLMGKLKNEGLDSKDASKTVYALWRQGALEFLESKPPLSFIRYTLTLKGSWFWGMTILCMLTISIVYYASVPPLLYLRYALGSLFVLYLPGSMLIEALYPKSQDLESLTRLALSISLSLAIIAIIGLLLNYTPWGIRLTPATISLAAFTEAMAIIGSARKYRYYSHERVLAHARSRNASYMK